MSGPGRSPVVIDTGVFGARLTPSGRMLAHAYQPLVEGRAVALSFVTVAELHFGALHAGWGANRRTRLAYELGRTGIVWPGPQLVEVYAELRVWCASAGHGLSQKEHEADRWVAAAALYLKVPLVAHDAIFRGVDGLELLTRLDLDR